MPDRRTEETVAPSGADGHVTLTSSHELIIDVSDSIPSLHSIDYDPVYVVSGDSDDPSPHGADQSRHRPSVTSSRKRKSGNTGETAPPPATTQRTRNVTSEDTPSDKLRPSNVCVDAQHTSRGAALDRRVSDE